MAEGFVQFVETWSPIDIILIAQNFDRFLHGAWVTLQLTILALLIGGILSIPLAIARAGNNPLLNAPVWVFTYVFRGTPLLVQTYLIYYGLGQFEWVRETFLWGPILSQAWWCALIAFSLNTAAYTTELLRGSIVTTSKGVTVHTIDCETLESFQATPERWIDLAWDVNGSTDMHVGRLHVVVANEPGSLGSLSTIIGKNQGNISNLKITNRSIDFFEMLVDVEVQDVKHLSNIIAALRATPVIASVERARA